jgi:hypothetical protein
MRKWSLLKPAPVPGTGTGTQHNFFYLVMRSRSVFVRPLLNFTHFCRKKMTKFSWFIKCRVVDPDPDWIRIQRLCGFGSGIRIPNTDPDPGVRKLRNFRGKMHFLVIFNKNFNTKKV